MAAWMAAKTADWMADQWAASSVLKMVVGKAELMVVQRVGCLAELWVVLMVWNWVELTAAPMAG
jgi:hypothetical protein